MLKRNQTLRSGRCGSQRLFFFFSTTCFDCSLTSPAFKDASVAFGSRYKGKGEEAITRNWNTRGYALQALHHLRRDADKSVLIRKVKFSTLGLIKKRFRSLKLLLKVDSCIHCLPPPPLLSCIISRKKM